MKNIFLKLFIFTAIAGFLLVGCQKEEGLTSSPDALEKNNQDVLVENGRLTFKSNEALSRTINLLLNMNGKELEAWEKRKGFVSLWSFYKKVYKEMENFTTNEEVYQIADHYSDYFEIIVDENGEEVMKPKIDNPVYAKIANMKGEYALPGKINKVIRNKVLSIDEEDYPEIASLSKNEMLAMIKDDEKHLKSNCGNNLQAVQTKDERWCKKDRRVVLKMWSASINGWSHTYTKIYGQRKFGCVWAGYSTVLHLKNVSFTIKYAYAALNYPPYGYLYHSYTGSFPTIQHTGYSYTCDWLHDVSDAWDGHDTYFTSAHGEATSQGVNGVWAEINCN